MLHCFRCAYSWYPRTARVRTCPRCKSIRWDVPRKPFPTPLGTGLGIPEVIGSRRAGLVRLLRRYGARDIRVFGSVGRGSATADSDVDLLVRFQRPLGLLRRAELQEKVESLVARPVDLVSENSLHWLARPRILAEARPL